MVFIGFFIIGSFLKIDDYGVCSCGMNKLYENGIATQFQDKPMRHSKAKSR